MRYKPKKQNVEKLKTFLKKQEIKKETKLWQVYLTQEFQILIRVLLKP